MTDKIKNTIKDYWFIIVFVLSAVFGYGKMYAKLDYIEAVSEKAMSLGFENKVANSEMKSEIKNIKEKIK